MKLKLGVWEEDTSKSFKIIDLRKNEVTINIGRIF